MKHVITQETTLPLEHIELTLPPTLYAVEGVTSKLFLTHSILSQTPEQYTFEISPCVGKIQNMFWEYTPDNAPFSTPLEVTVKENETVVAQGETVLNIAQKHSGEGKELNLLIIGDSLTAAGIYPTELVKLLDAPGNPKVTLLGTQTKDQKSYYEGYGGWTWKAFMSKSQKIVHNTAEHISPFVQKNGDDDFTLNFEQYFQKECNGKSPDIVTIMLGINDCFLLQKRLPNREAITKRIKEVLDRAELFLAALRAATPHVKIGLCLTPIPNSREKAFLSSYDGEFHQWTWRQVQHLLVQSQIEQFSNREDEHIYVIPTTLYVDSYAGYPDHNAVHPNAIGYAQIASAIYSWLKNII